MNWEAITAVGQATGAVAVVISLIYLAGQVRHARRSVDAASADAAIASCRDFIRMLIDDPEAGRIFASGQTNPATLSETERYRFMLMVNFYLMMTENIHYHWRTGTMDPELWESLRLKVTAGIAQPGIRSVWKLRRSGYGARFQTFVDAALADAPIESVEESSRRLGEPKVPASPEPAPAASVEGRGSDHVCPADGGPPVHLQDARRE